MHNKRFFAPPLTDLKDTMTETILATPPDAIFHVNTQSATANSALTCAIQSAHGGRQPMDFEDVRLWTAEHDRSARQAQEAMARAADKAERRIRKGGRR